MTSDYQYFIYDYAGPPLSPLIYRVHMDSRHHYRVWVLDKNDKAEMGHQWREVDLTDTKELDHFLNAIITCRKGGVWTK